MTNSIPGDIRVLDMSGDGLADRMYAADTGGRVWRFDIVNRLSGAALVEGGVLALAKTPAVDALANLVCPPAVLGQELI